MSRVCGDGGVVSVGECRWSDRGKEIVNFVVGIVQNVFRRVGEVTEATESRYYYWLTSGGRRSPAGFRHGCDRYRTGIIK